ncbi:MAG: PLDc N-terminal domain-containing protein [Lachnospiraceae bacterium]|nr:PLDc N-terminal domain-containing protein [Lachnospiraceae bacterium]
MTDIQELLPFIIPLVIIQFGLFAAAIIHILRHNTYKAGNRVMWVLVSFISIIGPVLYFTIGKGDE